MKIKIKENKMNIVKSLSSLSLALAMVGGLAMLSPSSADAAGKGNHSGRDRIIRICDSRNNFCRPVIKPIKRPVRPCNRKGFACLF